MPRRPAWSARVGDAGLLVAGVIHLLPLPGVLGAGQLQRLYGIDVGGHELELLMQHRALLLALVGAMLIDACFRRPARAAALPVGFASVLSFLWLAWPLAAAGALQKVFVADLVALSCLLLAAAFRGRTARQHA